VFQKIIPLFFLKGEGKELVLSNPKNQMKRIENREQRSEIRD